MLTGIDLTQNRKQAEYFNLVMKKLVEPTSTPVKIFSYGGAIRGGKTYVCLAIAVMIMRIFPRSRGHIIREDMPALQATTIPSMEKLIGASGNFKWHRSSSDYYVEMISTGSRLYFKGENISHDPELTDFLGLETNYIILEQTESLSEKLLNICLSRVGSWYLDKMLPGIILETFNPTQTWPKQKRYLPYIKGELPPEILFIEALPDDNPYVTDDQWEGWNMMDERFQRQFIKADWTNFDDQDNRWAFAFDRKKHVLSPQEWEQVYGQLVDPMDYLYLMWDFNRNPMVCTLIQWPDRQRIKVCKVYQLPNMGVEGICERIMADFPGMVYIVGGDYSGDTASVLYENEVSAFSTIQYVLGISDAQVQITPNPRLEKNRILCNTVLAHYPMDIHETEAAPLIFDMENVRTNADGTIDKGKPGERKRDKTKQADVLDTWRYWVNYNLADWNPMHES